MLGLFLIIFVIAFHIIFQLVTIINDKEFENRE